MKNIIEQLESYGFKKAGSWYITENTKELDFVLNEEFENKRVIYAFVDNAEVKYIGICDDEKTTLKDRMEKYKNKQGGSTNERIHYELKNSLKSGNKRIEIFALEIMKDEDGIKVPNEVIKKLAEDVGGVEKLLVMRFTPVWNIKYKEKLIKFLSGLTEVEVRILWNKLK